MQLIVAIVIAIFIFVWQQKLYNRMWDERLKIDISFKDSYVNVGDNSSLIEVINNDKYLPLPVLHVKFSTAKSFEFDNNDNATITDCYHRNDAFSVMANQKLTRKLTFKATKRGTFFIQGATVTAKDFFMTKTFANTLECNNVLYVFPRKIDTPEFDAYLNTVMGEIEAKKGLLEDPYTFRGIREYDVRDNMSKINWKASARSGELMVNQYGYSWEPKIKIVLNLDTNMMVRSEYITELSIELASSIAAEFLDNGISVGLVSNGLDMNKQPLGELSAGTTMEHMVTIDKYLAAVSGNSELDGFMELIDKLVASFDRESTYIIISAYHREDLLLKLDYLKGSGMDFHMVVPYLDFQGIDNPREYMYQWEVEHNEI